MKKSIIFFCSIITLVTITRCGNKGVLNHSVNGLDSLQVIEPKGHASYLEMTNSWTNSIGGTVLNTSTCYNYKDFEIEIEYYTSTNTLVDTKKITIYKIAEPGTRCFVFERLKEDLTQNLSKDISYTLKWKLLKATPVLRSANN